MRKLLLIGTILFAVACAAILFEVFRRTYFEPKGSPSHLRRVAAQINGKEPIDAGEMLELTGAESRDTTLVVHYQVLNALAANVTEPGKRQVREVLRGKACETAALREVLDNGATLRYVLVDMNKVPILDTEILRWECGGVTTARSSQ